MQPQPDAINDLLEQLEKAERNGTISTEQKNRLGDLSEKVLTPFREEARTNALINTFFTEFAKQDFKNSSNILKQIQTNVNGNDHQQHSER